jgi:hypothetical protein
MEYEFYQVSKKEVPLARSSGLWMNLPLLIYAYLFPSQEEKSTLAAIFVSRHLLAWVFACDCSFPDEHRLYELEFNPNAIQFIL